MIDFSIASATRVLSGPIWNENHSIGALDATAALVIFPDRPRPAYTEVPEEGVPVFAPGIYVLAQACGITWADSIAITRNRDVGSACCRAMFTRHDGCDGPYACANGRRRDGDARLPGSGWPVAGNRLIVRKPCIRLALGRADASGWGPLTEAAKRQKLEACSVRSSAGPCLSATSHRVTPSARKSRG